MKYDLNDIDPLPKLGPTVQEWVSPKNLAEYDHLVRDFARCRFEDIDYGKYSGITEADCRQVKPKGPVPFIPFIVAHMMGVKTSYLFPFWGIS